MSLKLKFVLGRIQNILGKGENADYQHFLLFPQCFQKAPCFKVVKGRNHVVKSYPLTDNKILDWSKLKQIADDILNCILPFSKRQILDSSKLKEFANDSFRFDESDGKFSKRVENSVGKGEIADYDQFLLFSHCFHKTCRVDT